MRRLEVCTGSIAGAVAARDGGAYRLELCSALSEGGLTPSLGLIEAVRRIEGIKLHVIIRPRGGNFVYSAEEIALMVADIEHCRKSGVDGVVIGALKPDGSIDMAACRAMVAAADGLSVTFHRAFDRCADPIASLRNVIALGCTRLLTSGHEPKAVDGLELIKELVRLSAGSGLNVMPGSGVDSSNAARILDYTGASEIHGSARRGAADTSLEEVSAIVRSINL